MSAGYSGVERAAPSKLETDRNSWPGDREDIRRPAGADGEPRISEPSSASRWSPLFAIADLAAGAWPERARRAAIELTTEGDDQGSIRVALLADIRTVFAAKATDRIASEDLVAWLVSLEDRPWPEYRGGKAISKALVARLLAPLHISPGTIRLADERTAKGYYRRTFDDAFARYLPAENVTTSQPKGFRGAAPDFKTSRGNGCDVPELPKNPSVPAGCDVVTERGAPVN